MIPAIIIGIKLYKSKHNQQAIIPNTGREEQADMEDIKSKTNTKNVVNKITPFELVPNTEGEQTNNLGGECG